MASTQIPLIKAEHMAMPKWGGKVYSAYTKIMERTEKEGKIVIQ